MITIYELESDFEPSVKYTYTEVSVANYTPMKLQYYCMYQ